jgi:hypothetical protein
LLKDAPVVVGIDSLTVPLSVPSPDVVFHPHVLDALDVIVELPPVATIEVGLALILTVQAPYSFRPAL